MNRDVSLLIKFSRHGGVDFFPILKSDGDSHELAMRIRRLLRVLIENPSLVECAAGHHHELPCRHRR